MRIPPDVIIKATIRPGSVYYFPEDTFNSEEPHYFIVVNKDPISETLLILVCASSRIEKVKQRRKSCPPQSLLEIGPDLYTGFRVSSIIDCNYVLEKSIDQIIEKLTAGQLVLKSEMDVKIIEQLRNGILCSPVIEKRIKEALR